MFYWLLKFVLLGPWLRLLFRPQVEGADNVPAKGAAIIASNHLSFSDSIFMPLMVPRRVTFLAKQEYFTGHGLKGLLSRMFFTGVGQVPIDRSSGSAAKAALDTGKRILAEGKLLGIYPEGTRSPDGQLYRGKTGVARTAIETGARVVPVAMVYRPRRLPFGLGRRLMAVEVRFGRPLDFGRYEGLSGDRFVERSITDEVMYEIMTLSGQEYVDVYGAQVKKSMDESGASASEVVGELQPPLEEAADRRAETLAG